MDALQTPGITCAQTVTADYASFPASNAGDTFVVGSCLNGYTGTATANCSLSGALTTEVSCVRKC